MEFLDNNQREIGDGVHGAEVGLHWLGLDGTILWANPADYESLGYTRSEYIGQNVARFHTSAKASEEIIRRLAQGERLQNHEARLRCKDGSMRSVLISSSPRFDNRDKLVHTRCFTIDVSNVQLATAEFQIEALIREVERLSALASRKRGLIEAMLYHSQHGIIVCDANGKLILQNRAAERIWAGSASTESIADWGQYRAFHADGRPFAPSDWSMAQCLTRREVTEREEIRIQRFDGSFGWLLGSSAPIIGPTGEVEGALVVFVDITHLKAIQKTNTRLVAAEREARAKAEAETRMREDLMAVVSHDLKNPLSSIVTATALLKMMGDANEIPERALKYIGTIARAADNMNRLVGDLLDLASIESGTFAVSCRPHELGAIVLETVELFSTVAKSKGVRLEATIEASGIYVHCDPPRVVQILSNLIANAIKFTPEGGLVRVDVDVDLGVGVGVGSSASEVRIAVSDTGPGIPSDDIEHIFDRYWRARQEPRTGIGLGLAIAKGLVEAQGGQIWVESQVAQGTTLFFTLRSAQRAPEFGLDARTANAEEYEKRRRLMVVDDDRELRESLCEFLEEAGYEVLPAANGVDALEQLQNGERPALILLDLMMPEMNGWQFREVQQQNAELASIPLLMMTASRNLKGSSTDPSSIIYKPLKLDQLLSTIDKHSARPATA